MRTIHDLTPSFVTLPLEQLVKPSKSTEALLKVLSKMPYLDLDQGPVIAGGSVVRAFLGKDEHSDFDVFCSNTSDYNEVAEKLEAAGAEWDLEYSPPGEASMEAGDVFVLNLTLDGLKIQVINMDLAGIPNSKPVDILRGFDVVNAMFATDGKNILFQPWAALGNTTGEVILNDSEYRHQLLAVRPKLDKNATRVAKYEALLNPSEFEEVT